MKTKLYLYGCALITAVFLMMTGSVFSQCNCAGGAPATEIVNATQYMYPTTASAYSLFFPKFDPSIGTLSCMKVTVTLQGKATTTGTITADSSKFSWFTSISPKIEAPTTSRVVTVTQSYFDDTLATQHWIDSVNTVRFPVVSRYHPSVIHGPEDLLVNTSLVAKGPASAAYYTDPGTPVEIKYSVSGGSIATEGGTNYTAGISTLTSGSFILYYYWCPAGVLAKNIRNFITKIENDNLKVNWTADSQSGNIEYEVQVSTDGINYKTVYTQPSQGAGGSSSNYEYLYDIPAGAGERLYVRIKQTEPSGKVTYTAINKVNLEGVDGVNTLSVYPNPAINKVSLQFETVMNGDFSIDIVSLTGQRLLNRQIKINKSKTASVDLNNPPGTGMYYLRATDKRTGSVYVNKLFMK